MSEARLTSEEVAALKAVLGKLAVRQRTGEIGIMYGTDRFVSSQLTLNRQERDALKSAASKMGVSEFMEVK